MGEREREPRNGAKEFLQGSFFRPVPGLVNWLRGPTAHAVGYVVSPSGLGALVAVTPLCGTDHRLLWSVKLLAKRPDGRRKGIFSIIRGKRKKRQKCRR